MTSLRVATWNIAGARRSLSDEHMDYSDEHLDYFVDELDKVRPDVICLQESHANRQDSLSKRLADALGFGYYYETPGCPSHIDSKYRLTCAILSKTELGVAYLRLPTASFELRLHGDGKVVPPYDRYVQIAKTDGIIISNIHTEPMAYFGRSYDEGDARRLAIQIDNLLTDNLENPLIFGGDFNMTNPIAILARLSSSMQLQDALPPNTPTRPDGLKTDHILCSFDLGILDWGIVKTQTDHYLCWAEVQYTK